MELHLIRHAHSEDTAPDEARRLTPRGRRQARALARRLRATGDFAPAEVWHSTLRRARETAELLAPAAPDAPRREQPGLAPEDDPAAVARRLARKCAPVAIVAHEPLLSTLASRLVTGAAEPVVFHVRKASALALTRVGRRWVVRWFLPPEDGQ
ncbi:MAG: phosphohistidine phosphatase SixA [Verrucomicrobia bacterium]|nr:phosphohistidine phosphatase SixA [Verrucomicrobiota bacterium]